MDAKILQALDRTQKETAHLALVPSPWLPATPSSKYRYNKADVFVHSSYPSDRTEDRISPKKKTGVCGEPSSTVRIFPTPPPLRNDKQSLEERAELVARLTLYRAIRRAPWSPSRRKRIDSDFDCAEDSPETHDGNGPERGGGIEIGGISMMGSGRNHLTGEYRNEEDEKAFRRINTSIDNTYYETPVARQNRGTYVPFDVQYEESLQQDLYRREQSNLSGEREKEKEKEKAYEEFERLERKVENKVEALRIEVPDPWDPLKFYTDRSKESAQRPSGFNTQQLSGFKSDLQQWDNTKNIAFELGYDTINSTNTNSNTNSNSSSNGNGNSNGNIPSEKSNAESIRSCQESSPRSAVLPGQQAYYVLRVRVVRRERDEDKLERNAAQEIRGVRERDRGRDRDRGGGESNPVGVEVKGAAAAAVVREQRGVLLVKRGVTKGSLLTALSAQFPSALSLRDGEPFLPSTSGGSSFSLTVSHTPIRSRIRVSDTFDDIRDPNSATDNGDNSLHGAGSGGPYSRGVSACGSPLHRVEYESMSTSLSNKKNHSNINSSSGSGSLPPGLGPFTPQPVVVSLTEKTSDFSPLLDETSELVLSYC